MSESSVVQEMREALLKIKSLFRDIDLNRDTIENEAYALADSALAIPLRNCDIGTVEEQQERFKYFCRREDGGTCLCCPCASYEDCVLAWTQLPYESEEGK